MATKKSVSNIKKLTYSVKEFNLDERCDFLDYVWGNVGAEKFSLFVWILRTATDLKDEQIDSLSSEDIIELSKEVSEIVNKKK